MCFWIEMSQSGIKDDVFSTGYFVEVVISTVGEQLREHSEMERQTETEMETAETRNSFQLSLLHAANNWQS